MRKLVITKNLRPGEVVVVGRIEAATGAEMCDGASG